MQQCNICSSNPNNKTYNYHMFEPDEYAKPTRPSNGIIIEGLDAVAQSSIVTDSTTEFNDSYYPGVNAAVAEKIVDEENYLVYA